MKYYIIAGEASGDMHGANLIKAIKEKDQQAFFRVWGGDRMANAGGELVRHIRDLSFMGFKEVLMNLYKIIANIRFCKQDIRQYSPDVVILIDYPGFNLRIAKAAKQAGFKVIYYISPQVWAWKESRVKGIKKWVDQMLVILPFEQKFYEARGVKAHFVGHPLIDVVDHYKVSPDFLKQNNLEGKPLIAMVPGSRKQEIAQMLPEMLKVVPHFAEYEFVIGGAPGVEEAFYQKWLQELKIPVVFNQTYDLFSYAKAGMVTSGTATLEAALFQMPEVVCYKGSKISYWIARKLVNVKHIALVNIIMDQTIVEELIQDDMNEDYLVHELYNLVEDKTRKSSIFNYYSELRSALGSGGASKNAANEIIKFMKDYKF